MTDWIARGLLFAEDAAPKEGGAPPDVPFMFLTLILPIMIMFYFLVHRPQKREQAQRQAMLSALKKNDRVLTIGGMIGTVANISADGQEVTLKVDDNTRIKVIHSAIQRVLSAEGEGEKPPVAPS